MADSFNLDEAEMMWEKLAKEFRGLFNELYARYLLESCSNPHEAKLTYDMLKSFFKKHSNYLTDKQIKDFKDLEAKVESANQEEAE